MSLDPPATSALGIPVGYPTLDNALFPPPSPILPFLIKNSCNLTFLQKTLLKLFRVRLRICKLLNLYTPYGQILWTELKNIYIYSWQIFSFLQNSKVPNSIWSNFFVQIVGPTGSHLIMCVVHVLGRGGRHPHLLDLQPGLWLHDLLSSQVATITTCLTR